MCCGPRVAGPVLAAAEEALLAAAHGMAEVLATEGCKGPDEARPGERKFK